MQTDRIAVMPGWLVRRHQNLNEAARDCYQLRNEAGVVQDPAALAFHDLGDVYFARALAILGEWS